MINQVYVHYDYLKKLIANGSVKISATGQCLLDDGLKIGWHPDLPDSNYVYVIKSFSPFKYEAI